jgi:hypothetical protein
MFRLKLLCGGCCSWSQQLVGEDLAERFIAIDFAEVDTVFDRCLQVGFWFYGVTYGNRQLSCHTIPNDELPL